MGFRRNTGGGGLYKYMPPTGRDTLLALEQEKQTHYPTMKMALIKKFGLTPEKYRQKFRGSHKLSTQNWVDFLDYARKALEGWVQGSEVKDYEGLYDLFLKEHLLEKCFPELRQHLVDSKLTNPRKLAEEADIWASTPVSSKGTRGDSQRAGQGAPQKKEGGDKKQDFSKGPQNSFQGKGTGFTPKANPPRNPHPGQSQQPRVVHCFECGGVGHYKGDVKCPKRPSPPTGGKAPGVASVAFGEELPLVKGGEWAGVTLVSLVDREMVPRIQVPPNTTKYGQWITINGQRGEALRDTGASMTMVGSQLVSPDQVIPNVLHPAAMADGRMGYYPVAEVPFEWEGVAGSLRVAISPAVPVDCLLGNDMEHNAWREVEYRTHSEMLGTPDWACVSTRSATAQRGSSPGLDPGTMAQPAAKKGQTRRQEKPASASTPHVTDRPPAVVSQESVEGEVVSLEDLPIPAEWHVEAGPTREEFCKGQKECPTLEGLRRQAEAQAAGNVAGHYHIYWEDGLLYSEPKVPLPGSSRALVVPQRYRAFLLELAHEIPLAGHLGQDKTFARLVPHFYWPQMKVASDTYCRTCVSCQASGKTGVKLKAPLEPLPVVSTPFERVGIDIVGPLDPPTTAGHRFILVLVDHATRYPEAIPLRTVTAPVVARALMGIFTRVGFPKEVVSDRGTNFMSAYMRAMWKECGVTYRFTTPYHPQSNGLVERFNKTLKGMIRSLPESLQRKWDVLLPCLLFSYREAPQKGVGFSPFELLYGHPVRGPLSLVKDGWEKSPTKPPQDVVSYMLAFRSQMAKLWKQASDNLEASQAVMKEWYDHNAHPVDLEPGQKVWVMEPGELSALQDRWTGPFEVLEKKGKATYLVDLKTPRQPLRVLHANRLKPHHERPEVILMMVTDGGEEAESEPLPDLFSSQEKDGSVEGVVLSPSLTPEQREDCRQILEQYSTLFSLVPGRTHLCTHDVDTGDSPPVKSKTYRLSDKVKASIHGEVTKMLELGVIEPSSSPWSSPVVLVPKAAPPGTTPELRFCVDYRGLNSITKTNAHPIPRADELIDRLGAAQYLSTFDLTSGYWQISLTDGAKERSAFSTPEGHCQFCVMPFGLKNAPATFQRLVNQVLSGMEGFSAAYLDDIAVFSSSWEDHLQHLQAVLQALKQAGLTIKASKCQIGQGSVVYLGHLVGRGAVQPLQAKIEAIMAWEPPKTQTEVRAFLGLTGYYRRFVKGYGTIVAPLTELTSKKQPRRVVWTEACQQAFEKLKQAMCAAPVLRAPDFSKEFIVQTDASEHGIGAVLSQLNEEGLDQPVVFLSRRLLPREPKWSAIEREAFAVVWALKNLRPYLFGSHLLVQTDHRPLRWLMQMKGENPKLLRWSISLQGMDFRVEHRPRVDHANADGLSRYFRLSDEDSQGVG
ncbi:uncharacterized protein LOC144753011 [Lissotriton helveticus]